MLFSGQRATCHLSWIPFPAISCVLAEVGSREAASDPVSILQFLASKPQTRFRYEVSRIHDYQDQIRVLEAPISWAADFPDTAGSSNWGYLRGGPEHSASQPGTTLVPSLLLNVKSRCKNRPSLPTSVGVLHKRVMILRLHDRVFRVTFAGVLLCLARQLANL